jgi:hypothetical protein
VAQTIQDKAKPSSAPTQLRESAADRVSSFIVSMLILIGGLVAVLLFIWFSMAISRPPPVVVPVKLDPGSGGDPLGVPGEVLHIEGPERDEISKETDVVEPALEETMAMVTDALAKQVADLDNPIYTEDLVSGGPEGGHKGNSSRAGYGFGGGPGGGGPTWEMQYDESTLAIYTQQLDAFGIELAVVGGNKDQIEYASGFSQGQPRRRTGTRDQEMRARRTYFTHRSGTIQKYDQQLLTRAGINWQAQGKIILQYYPKVAEDRLLVLQEQFRGLKQESILKTIFGARARGNGFEFFVVDQIRR